MLFNMKKTGLRGFTLIELLVVFAILIVGSTAGMASFRRIADSKALDVSAAEVESLLNNARISAVTQTIPQPPIVCIFPKKWKMYSVRIISGNSYEMGIYCDGDRTTIKTGKLPTGVTFNVLPAPNNEIFFLTTTGTSPAAGTITLIGTVGQKQITIDTSGNITRL